MKKNGYELRETKTDYIITDKYGNAENYAKTDCTKEGAIAILENIAAFELSIN